MARDARGRSRTQRLTDMVIHTPGAAVGAVQGSRERLNRALLPVAWVLGGLGLLALAACGVGWLLPEERWPDPLDRDLLPAYAVGSLCGASLLGWGCMQQGLRRLRRRVREPLGGWLFVLMPLLCAVLVGLEAHERVAMDEWPGAPWVGHAVRVYTPLLVVLALLAFLATWSRADDGRERRLSPARALGAAALVLPYGLLSLWLLVRFDAPWLSDNLEEVLDELGAGAFALQLVLAYFVSSGAGGSA